MPVLTLMPSGKTAEVPSGTVLLSTILASGEKLGCTCGGTGGCEASHVFVLEGRKSLSKAERPEHATLDGLVGVSSKSRLACQAKMGEEDVTIEILSFM
ncbi:MULTISPECIES: 2Fe-2S iron-sulfur cluster-binding protein [Uliginosibacterium]|uniref:2Fe-2S iron-sulfur cluster binding domain-containing protein n=1 Tax=Uliginosibacterium aquaticum TaxID=2731212 RepID=A0ABX2ILD4_9RHOO|nr:MULTISPECIES: 2Fe-2S iron-sulfur cluster-binding protein [Uliginosibacterium]MDO6385314.1 2Fe-2S iron-sulfur cluster-binding protein [Uliginosibacterium sp. 31-12]NSL54850.1 2Fe-2S iron-sulfur cluster binding domain-containing protein [Uliginosibacterium aquaticum]PLK47788.1 ferredoxin [Uliginosibacterium sp. TH139]